MKHFYLRLLFGLLLCCYALSSTAQVLSIGQSKIDLKEEIANLKIFPNPANDRFTISIPATSVKYITINNVIGKQIRKVPMGRNKFFNVEDLKKGVYIIRIFDHKEELLKALKLSKA